MRFYQLEGRAEMTKTALSEIPAEEGTCWGLVWTSRSKEFLPLSGNLGEEYEPDSQELFLWDSDRQDLLKTLTLLDGWFLAEDKEEFLEECFREDRIPCVSESSWEYAEPGYTDPERGILLGNWNNLPEKVPDPEEPGETMDFFSWLERQGFALEWEDEWVFCSDCGKAVRTQPDSYSWTPSYSLLGDCTLLCVECLKEDPESVISEFAGNAKKALTFDLPLEDLGWVRVLEDLETGFHSGQNADPQKVKEELSKVGIDRPLFKVSGKGQFDTSWEVWVSQEELDGLDPETLAGIPTQGRSPSRELQEGLRNLSHVQAEMGRQTPGTVRIAQINGPEVSIRDYTGEEFVAGIR